MRNITSLSNIMRYLRAAFACTVLCCLFPPLHALADDEAGLTESTLTGDWGGRRASLADKGIDIGIVYKFDVMSNVSGGIKRGAQALDNLDVIFSLDGEKLIGFRGASALIHFLNNNSSQPGAELVGAAQGVDNIEVPATTGKLYQAWIQQKCMDDKLSVLAGLYDLNSEFYVTDSSGIFIQPTFGIGTDMSQSGQNGPSIFPFTSVAVRVKAQPNGNFFVQAVVLDGAPGDPDNPKGNRVALHHGDGSLLVGEAGYIPGGEAHKGKIGLGAWSYTAKFDDLVDFDAAGNPAKRPGNGLYVLGERRIYQVPGHDDRGLTAFARVGVANGDVHQFDYAWSAGAVYTGLFPGRDQGRLGLGVNGAHTSRKYRKSVVPADESETAFELTYSDNLTPWLAVQPDIQYIINPGVDPELKNAVVVGTRVTAKF